MTMPLNYTLIVHREGGATTLYDPYTAGLRNRALEEIQTLYGQVFELVRRSDFYTPDEAEAYDLAVIHHGGKGLRDCILKTTVNLLPEKSTKFYRQMILRQTDEGIPAELLQEADRLCHEIARKNDGVPIAPEDLSFDAETGLRVDAEAVTGKIEAGCSWPLTDADKELAQEIKAAILNLRKLRSKRVNIRRLVERWLGDPVQGGFPEIGDIDLFRAASVELLPPDAVIRHNLEIARTVPGLRVVAGVPIPAPSQESEVTPAAVPDEKPLTGKNAYLRKQGLL